MSNITEINLNNNTNKLHNILKTQDNNTSNNKIIKSDFPQDIVDIKWPNERNLLAQNGEVVNLKFISSGNIKATLNRNNAEYEIKTYDLPSDLKKITNLVQFNKFFDNAYIKTKELSDDSVKVEVNQKLKGGSGNGGFTPNLIGSKDGYGFGLGLNSLSNTSNTQRYTQQSDNLSLNTTSRTSNFNVHPEINYTTPINDRTDFRVGVGLNINSTRNTTSQTLTDLNTGHSRYNQVRNRNINTDPSFKVGFVWKL